MTDRFVTIGTDCNGRFNAYESDGTRIPLNRTGYASADRTVAALRRFYVVAPGATPGVTLGGWTLSGMAHPDRAIAPRDEAFVGRMIDHDIACEAKARARSDAALAALTSGAIEGEPEAARRDRLEAEGYAFTYVAGLWHWGDTCPGFASLTDCMNDAESPRMVPQQAQQQQANAAAARIAHPLPAGTRIRTKGGDWDSFIDEETDEDVERHAAPGEVGTVTAAPEHHAGQGWTYSVEFSPSGVWVFLDQAEVDDPAQYEVLPAMVPMPAQQQQGQAASVYIETRTLAGEVIRRHGPFARDSRPCRDAWHAEHCACEGHNRSRRHDDRSAQRVYTVDAPTPPAPAFPAPHPDYAAALAYETGHVVEDGELTYATPADREACVSRAFAAGWRLDVLAARLDDWPWYRLHEEGDTSAVHRDGEWRFYVETAAEALAYVDEADHVALVEMAR